MNICLDVYLCEVILCAYHYFIDNVFCVKRIRIFEYSNEFPNIRIYLYPCLMTELYLALEIEVRQHHGPAVAIDGETMNYGAIKLLLLLLVLAMVMPCIRLDNRLRTSAYLASSHLPPSTSSTD